MSEALGKAQSAGWRAAKARALQQWEAFVHDFRVDARLPRGSAVAAFLLHRLFAGRIDVRAADALQRAAAAGIKPKVAASTVALTLSALRAAFDDADRAALLDAAGERLVARVLTAMRKLAPSQRGATTVGHTPPHSFVSCLPSGDSYAAVRDRAIFMVRAVALLRPSEPLEIVRSSIREVDNGLGRKVVVFKLKRTKATSAKGVAFDTNFVDFLARDARILELPPGLHAVDFCPATLLLECKTRVDAASGSSAHESVFCVADDRLGNVLSADRCSSIVRDILRKAGYAGTSHSLRALSAQQLALMGIAPSDIELRGGWASALVSAVRINHYTSNRLVTANFADILFDERQRSTVRHGRRVFGSSAAGASASLGDHAAAAAALVPAGANATLTSTVRRRFARGVSDSSSRLAISTSQSCTSSSVQWSADSDDDKSEPLMAVHNRIELERQQLATAARRDKSSSSSSHLEN